MFKEVIEFISSYNKGKAGKMLMQHTEYWNYVSLLYPLYEIKDIMWMLRRGHTEQKVCLVCNGKLNRISDDCCSRSCSNKYRIISGTNVAIQEKIRNTCLARYGTSTPAQVEAVKEKRRNTCMDKYGSMVSPKLREAARAKADDLNKKGRETLYNRYGVTNPGKLPGHSDKVKHTNLEKYGNECYFLSEEGKQKVKKQRVEKWSIFSQENDIEVTDVVPGVLNRPNQRIHYRCTQCNTSDIIPHETFKWRIFHYQSACATCLNLDTGSVKETQVYEYIKSIYQGTIKRNDRELLAGKEIDIVLPDLKIGIEFNGLYWHSDHIITDKDHHRSKFLLAKAAGYRLITIFEDEWDFSVDIVKAKLRSIVNTTLMDKVYARNTTVKVINDVDAARAFINKNHIQGYAQSSIKIGLFDDTDCLVACMTFSRLSKAKGQRHKDGHWEISRYATSKNVIGGFSKLFSFFVKTYDPKYVLSYSDLRWGEGNTYAHAGFVRGADTTPGYWYHRAARRYHRYGLRKQPDEDNTKTEYELRIAQGYTRIWDCGNAKWEWKPATI